MGVIFVTYVTGLWRMFFVTSNVTVRLGREWRGAYVTEGGAGVVTLSRAGAVGET